MVSAVFVCRCSNVSQSHCSYAYAFYIYPMKELDYYYSDDAIIRMLCKIRARISHKRHKKHMARDISKHIRTNKISISKSDVDFLVIQPLFPTRRNWKKLNKDERLDPNRFNNSIEKNSARLFKSYLVEKTLVNKDSKMPEQWYINLLTFCSSIRERLEGIINNEYKIEKPKIFPILKGIKNGKFVYRPITKYSIYDKIITSAFAKYLTEKFDHVFLDCSFAFRARKNGVVPTHHDSVIQILKYRKKKKKLWVAECDIQKFYDAVQHIYLEKVFLKEIKNLENNGVRISPKAIKLFLFFLNSYAFNKDVLPKNDDPTYFKNNGVPNGSFGWVENELKLNFGERYTRDYRIGVPQGNAVSCFIANLILNRVDKTIVDNFKDVLYVRYCDDMILAHPDREVCKQALEVYKENIKKSFLIYHQTKQFKNYKDSGKDFWEFKSKEPYYWGNKYHGENNIPWLSFVGYQINYKGHIRVRKDSIEKEIRKQIKETQNVLIALGMDKNRNLERISDFSRKSKNQIEFSLQQRLISMSTGRITIYNYDSVDQGLCWTNGFNLLNNNEVSQKQLKELDKRREQQISYLKRSIMELNTQNEDEDERPDYMKKQNIYFGKPFSYVQFLDKK